MAYKVPQYVVIGDRSSSSMNFDDYVQLKSLEFKMIGFKVSLDDEKICGIQFVYQNVNSGRKITCNDLCVNGKNINQYEFEIGQNDYIQVIYGYHEQYITQFGVITYKGQQVMFGKDKGSKKNFLFMGYTYTTAFGTYKKGMIESLGFRTCKLPRKIILEQFSPLIDILYPINDNFVLQPQQSYPIDSQNNNSYSALQSTIMTSSQISTKPSNYQQQSEFAGTMARTALGTFAAIETVRMIENKHHNHHHANVVVVGNHHHHHHESHQGIHLGSHQGIHLGSHHGIHLGGHHGIHLGGHHGIHLGRHGGHHRHHGGHHLFHRR